mgnify:CR=1
ETARRGSRMGMLSFLMKGARMLPKEQSR